MALLPNRNVLDGSKIPATTTSEMKTALGSLRDYLAGLLGTDSTDTAAARAALGVDAAGTALALSTGIAAPRVQGLTGAPNAATPLTKYDLSADSVTLRNAAGGTVARYVTGTPTNDLGLAGIAANGRDQAAAFAINSWIYLYFIWDGATLATVSSLAAPTVGPALPTGYTHWAFATALRWNASSNVIPALTNGHTVHYELAAGGVNRVLAAGVATSMTAVSCASLCPPNTTLALVKVRVAVSNASVATFSASYRPTGSSVTSIALVQTQVQVAGGSSSSIAQYPLRLNSSQQFDYQINTAPTSGGVDIDISGFTIPNGDA